MNEVFTCFLPIFREHRFDKNDDSIVRVGHLEYATLQELALATGDARVPHLAQTSEVARARARLSRILEKGVVTIGWPWSLRRLLLIRDKGSFFGGLPKDICRLLVRKYLADQVSLFLSV